MPTGPNDTDPQSPRALANRTDPGLGGEPAVLGPRKVDLSATPPPAVPTPSPGSASIEELLDGITGPRPPPARRDVAPSSTRAYAAARHAPSSQRMPPREPLVVSPVPPMYGNTEPTPRPLGAMGEDVPLRIDPQSTRPVVRRGEERTVYTGRRALIRNVAVALGSSIVVALTMLTIMRWKEAQRAPLESAAAAQVSEGETEVVQGSAGNEIPPAPEATAIDTTTSAAAPAARRAESSLPSSESSAPAAERSVDRTAKPASVAKRVKVAPAPKASAESLDDLNRQIRH